MNNTDPRAWLAEAQERAHRWDYRADLDAEHQMIATDHPAMAAALTSVLDLHTEFAQGIFAAHPVCSACRMPYPCPTVRTITDHLKDNA